MKKKFASNKRVVEEDLLQRRLQLEEDLRFLKTLYDACLRLRQSAVHRDFSPELLWHEAEAFARMERQRGELLHQLSQLTPRGD